jgi:hypothetical protein
VLQRHTVLKWARKPLQRKRSRFEPTESDASSRPVAVVDALAFALALNVPLVDLLTPEAGSVALAPGVEPIANHAVAA